jgi:hypothetical protein
VRHRQLNREMRERNRSSSLCLLNTDKFMEAQISIRGEEDDGQVVGENDPRVELHRF